MANSAKGLLLTLALFLLTSSCLAYIEEFPLPNAFLKCLIQKTGNLTVSDCPGEAVVSFCLNQYLWSSCPNRWHNEFDQNIYVWMQSTFSKGCQYKTKKPRVRKEYRMLTDKERQKFHKAIQMLKKDKSVYPNKYDAIAAYHNGAVVESAHRGPNFFGWHRCFLYIFEEALREKDPDVTLPYWDVTLDAGLIDPKDSIMWSDKFVGGGDGVVRNGPFRNWRIEPSGPLTRNLASGGELFDKFAVHKILSKKHMTDISEPNGNNQSLEFIHNQVHRYVGGTMQGLTTAAYDPLFYMFHCFIDYIWYLFREQQKRYNIDPSKDYPNKGENGHLPPNRPMDGFSNYTNIDGYSEHWTKEVYTYQKSPYCSKKKPDCGSPYLRCDVRRSICITRTRWYKHPKHTAGNHNQHWHKPQGKGIDSIPKGHHSNFGKKSDHIHANNFNQGSGFSGHKPSKQGKFHGVNNMKKLDHAFSGSNAASPQGPFGNFNKHSQTGKSSIQPYCKDDSGCGPAFTCDIEHNICVPNSLWLNGNLGSEGPSNLEYCSHSKPKCSKGLTCNMEIGLCVFSTSVHNGNLGDVHPLYCKSDAECKSNWLLCDIQLGLCLPKDEVLLGPTSQLRANSHQGFHDSHKGIPDSHKGFPDFPSGGPFEGVPDFHQGGPHEGVPDFHQGTHQGTHHGTHQGTHHGMSNSQHHSHGSQHCKDDKDCKPGDICDYEDGYCVPIGSHVHKLHKRSVKDNTNEQYCSWQYPDCGEWMTCNYKTNKCEYIDDYEFYDDEMAVGQCGILGTPYQNDYSCDGVSDVQNLVYIPVQIYYTRPRGRIYGSYIIQEGKVNYKDDIYDPTYYKDFSGFINQGQLATYQKCHDTGSGASKVWVQANGFNYEGSYTEYAIVDERLPVSTAYAYIGVKNPGHGFSEVFLTAYDSCGRLCKPRCKIPNTHPPKYRPCSGAIRVNSKQPLGYGKTYAESILNVWNFGDKKCPHYKEDNVFVVFYCDYEESWMWHSCKKGLHH